MKDNLLYSVPFEEKIQFQKKKDFKEKALEELGRICVKCGCREDLTIHHKVNRSDCRIKNLEVLCRNCHDIKHYGKVTNWRN